MEGRGVEDEDDVEWKGEGWRKRSRRSGREMGGRKEWRRTEREEDEMIRGVMRERGRGQSRGRGRRRRRR